MATCGVSLDDGNIAKTTVDEMFDEIVMNAPDVMFDCRAYYWPNFHSPSYIMHSFSKFTFSFTLPTISVPGSYYVATFGEPLLLTWVGLQTKVRRRIGASTNILVNAVNGNDPFTSTHNNVFHYCKVPPPIRQQEQEFVHNFISEDKVDTGLAVHYRVHKDFSIEMKVRFDESCVVYEPTVVLKVQTPTLVGGLEDHPKWNMHTYLHMNGDKTRKYFPSFLEYKTWMSSVNKDHKST